MKSSIVAETYFPDFDILISMFCVFTHFDGVEEVVGAGGVVTEVGKLPPLTSKGPKQGFFALKMQIISKELNSRKFVLAKLFGSWL